MSLERVIDKFVDIISSNLVFTIVVAVPNYVKYTIAGSFMAILYQFGSYLYAAVSTCHIGLSISRSASDVSEKVYVHGGLAHPF